MENARDAIAVSEGNERISSNCRRTYSRPKTMPDMMRRLQTWTILRKIKQQCTNTRCWRKLETDGERHAEASNVEREAVTALADAVKLRKS